MDVSTQSTKDAGGEAMLRVAIHVNVSNLPFEHRKDRSEERLIFVSALFNAQGNYLTGLQQVVDLSLKEAMLEQLSGSGFTANVSLQAPVGTYRLRTVVQETANGHLAAVSRPVEIR